MKYHGFDSRKGLVVCLFIFSGFYVAAASVIVTFNFLTVNSSLTSSQKELVMFTKQGLPRLEFITKR